jgi:hypothetical protein
VSYHILFDHSSFDGHLGYVLPLGTVNIHEFVFICMPVFGSFWYKHSRSGIAGSYGNSVFNFLRFVLYLPRYSRKFFLIN